MKKIWILILFLSMSGQGFSQSFNDFWPWIKANITNQSLIGNVSITNLIIYPSSSTGGLIRVSDHIWGVSFPTNAAAGALAWSWVQANSGNVNSIYLSTNGWNKAVLDALYGSNTALAVSNQLSGLLGVTNTFASTNTILHLANFWGYAYSNGAFVLDVNTNEPTPYDPTAVSNLAQQASTDAAAYTNWQTTNDWYSRIANVSNTLFNLPTNNWNQSVIDAAAYTNWWATNGWWSTIASALQPGSTNGIVTNLFVYESDSNWLVRTGEVFYLGMRTNYMAGSGGGADTSTTNFLRNATNLTNNMAVSVSSWSNDAGYVTKTVTNGLASTFYVDASTNGFVKAGITNGLASVSYVDAATNTLAGFLNAKGISSITTHFVEGSTNGFVATNTATASDLTITFKNTYAALDVTNKCLTNLVIISGTTDSFAATNATGYLVQNTSYALPSITNLCVTNFFLYNSDSNWIARTGNVYHVGVRTNYTGSSGVGITGATNNTFSANVTINSNLTVSGTNVMTALSGPIFSVILSSNVGIAASVSTVLIGTNIVTDTHNGFNATTYQYTLPSSHPGHYRGFVTIRYGVANSAANSGANLWEITPTFSTNCVSQSAGLVTSGQSLYSFSRDITYTGGTHVIYAVVYSGGATNIIQGNPSTVQNMSTHWEVYYIRGL